MFFGCSQMGAGGWVLMLALWGLVLALVVWAVCRLFPTQRTANPRAVLDARLASGQIDLETYHRVLGQLDVATPVAR